MDIFLCSFIKEKGIKLKYILPGVSFGSMLLLGTYVLGGFSTRADSNDAGLGAYSFNLNGFFNEKGYSRFFDALPMYDELQYEGFAYLGLGIFVLLIVTAVFCVVVLTKKKEGCMKKKWAEIVVGMLVVVGLVVFAASPVVTWNDKLLFILTDSSTLTRYWSIFRSTGRIIWPVNYLIYTAVIVCNARLWNSKKSAVVGSVVLALCCFLQVFEISEKLCEQRAQFAQKKNLCVTVSR